MHSCDTSWTSASSLFPVCHYWTNLINSGVPDYCCCDYWGQTQLDWSVCPIMENRKQGAGCSSGSSGAVHKGNFNQGIVTALVLLQSKSCRRCSWSSTCRSIIDWLSNDSSVGGSGLWRTGSSESDSQSGATVMVGKPLPKIYILAYVHNTRLSR